MWWHVFAGTAFVILLPAIAPTHQSASWVFTTFAPDKAYSGIDSNGLLFLLSLLGSQWAMGEFLVPATRHDPHAPFGLGCQFAWEMSACLPLLCLSVGWSELRMDAACCTI